MLWRDINTVYESSRIRLSIEWIQKREISHKRTPLLAYSFKKSRCYVLEYIYMRALAPLSPIRSLG